MAIDTQALAGQINAIYESALGRPADVEGLMYYANSILSGGGSLADVQRSIAASPEAQVRAAYSDVLGRPADAAGQKFYADQAIAGTPIADIRKSLAYSPEAQSLIENIYTTDLNRAADVGGKQFYTDRLAAGGLLSDVKASVQASPEAKGLLGITETPVTVAPPVTTAPVVTPVVEPPAVTPVVGGNLTLAPGTPTDYTSFLNPIYREVFGRDVDASGLKFYGDLVAGGATAADVRASLLGSPEYANLLANKNKTTTTTNTAGTTDYTSFLNPIYREVFGRDVDASGLNFYSNWLAQGRSAADIKASLMGSPEYASLLAGRAKDAAAEAASPAGQLRQRNISEVPFGSQLIGGQVKQMAQYGQPAAQAGAAMGAPSLQGFLAGNPAAAAMTPFQQALQYQAALPGMIQPFNPADIPATYQQRLSPTQRLDISSTVLPGWLQQAVNEQKEKDGATLSETDKFRAANVVPTNSGLTPVVTPGVTPVVTPGVTPVVTPGVTPVVTPGVTPVVTPGVRPGGSGIAYDVNSLYKNVLGRDADVGGLTFYGAKVMGGSTLADVEASLRGSDEYRNLTGGGGGGGLLTTNTGNLGGTVTPGATGGLLNPTQISPDILNAYGTYLGRTADLPGASYWQTRANQGMSIADVIANISGSPEGLLYAPIRADKLAAAANTTGNIVPD